MPDSVTIAMVDEVQYPFYSLRRRQIIEMILKKKAQILKDKTIQSLQDPMFVLIE